MHIFKTCLLSAVTGLFATHALADDLVVENKSSHKISAKVVKNAFDGGKEAYALTIDGSKVSLPEIEMLRFEMEQEEDELVDEADLQALLQVINDQPLFPKEEGQKIVFSDAEDRCGKGGVSLKVTSKTSTWTGCLQLEEDPQGKALWLYFEDFE